MKRKSKGLLAALLLLFGLTGGLTYAFGPEIQAHDFAAETSVKAENTTQNTRMDSYLLTAQEAADVFADVPDYSGEDYIELNGGVPAFSETDIEAPEGTEVYGELDSLGRATGAFAKLCANTRPKSGSKRDTRMPNPSGFVQAYYDSIGLNHLYERSHLIAYSLSDEAVNPRDLITGTEHLNQDTMQPFEGAIRNYIELANEITGYENHVIMRVTPDFRGNDLVAHGVQIEAYSVEDGGDSISLNVYCYNIQPGIEIDYATGESRLA